MIFKNLRSHLRSYAAFFLCNSFAIMLMFLFFNLQNNRQITKSIGYLAKDMFMAISIAVIVFVYGFLCYAYWAFVKGRRVEFGLFQVLGMTQKDLRQLIFLENSAIVLTSLFLGLLSGRLFSRLFFMLVLEILHSGGIEFSVGFNEYGMTIMIYLFLFLMMNFIGGRVIKRLEFYELLRFDRRAESYHHHPLLLLLGILLMVGAYLMKYAEATHLFYTREASTTFVVMLLPGFYLVITQAGKSLMDILERNRIIKYKNLLGFSTFKHKLFQNQTAIYLMSMLNALILYFVGDAFNRWLYGIHIMHANREEGLLLVFVSVFLALLFFIAGCTVISFKLFNGIQQEKRQFEKLNRIGITSAEEESYLTVELKLLFFAPVVAGLLIVTPFVLIENLRQGQQWNQFGTYLIIMTVYAVIQLVLYHLVKKQYHSRIYE
jgi:hypothetical protein